jgi:predicted helicase
MRQSLLAAFDEIYLLDLHGNVKKKETMPDGSKDENVFDIQQGVAIGIFVKRPGSTIARPATVRHAHLWGPREVHELRHGAKDVVGGKHAFLYDHDLTDTKWKVLKPRGPFYLFVPQDVKLRQEYESGWKATEMMPVNVLGFQTHRDHFAIDLDSEMLQRRIAEMRDTRTSDHDFADKYDLKDNRDWRLAEARESLRRDVGWREHLLQCLYRPFDRRACYFSSVAMDFPRRELLAHVARKRNYCLGLGRQGIAVNDPQWSLVTVSPDPVDANVFRRGGVNLFPLFLYPDPEENGTLFANGTERHVNLTPEFIGDLRTRLRLSFVAGGMGDLKKTFGPEDVLHYAYAVLHSPAYRTRYAEFLKIDFPRLPLTGDLGLFRVLAAVGAELVGLHLLESPKLDEFLTTWPVKGDDVVERVEYVETDERVWINKSQFFGGVHKAVWDFHVGGYQVCHKWLKDRKGRKLTYEDTQHYQRTVVALNETIRLTGEIDEAIDRHGGWPIR